MEALSILLNLPGLLMHVRNLHHHPHMALAGTVANCAMICELGRVNEKYDEFLHVVYQLSIAEFLYSFHHIFETKPKQAAILRQWKYVMFCFIVYGRHSILPILLLYLYAMYVASFAPCFHFHMYYICFHGLFNLVESLQVLVHVCSFFLMVSAYQIGDICDFIRELEIDAA